MVEGEGGGVWVGYQQALWLGRWTIHRTRRPAAITLSAVVVHAHAVWASMPLTSVVVYFGPLTWRWDGCPVRDGNRITLQVTDRPVVSRNNNHASHEGEMNV